MGTSVEVQAFGGDETTRRAAIDEAFAAFAEVDRLMSNYRTDSELSHVNREAARRRRHRQRSDARGPRRRPTGERSAQRRVRRHRWPARAALGIPRQEAAHADAAGAGAVRPLVDYRNVRARYDHNTVRFARPASRLDLGGIAKGFAVEVAAGVLRRRGLAGFIDAGGNQYLLGTPPGKR